MTVITLTTVGFREVHELVHFGERLWTMLLAVSGVGIIFFGSIGIVAETIISEAASGRREAKRMREAVDGLGDDYIVCGYGRVGSTVITGARAHGAAVRRHRHPCAEPLGSAPRRDGHLVVMGDATDDSNPACRRRRASAGGLITTVDSDANNVYITLSARAMNQSLFIVARASAPGAEAKLLQAGREPHRVALHHGRAAGRGAGDPPAGRGLHRCRALAREPVVLARGGRGRRGEPAHGRDRRGGCARTAS